MKKFRFLLIKSVLRRFSVCQRKLKKNWKLLLNSGISASIRQIRTSGDLDCQRRGGEDRIFAEEIYADKILEESGKDGDILNDGSIGYGLGIVI